ncbi:Exosome complex component rrp43 [Golovinomyces cichoracearum]|uniref:Ribosomal RNA-processing protein 43 n=1 Tax=Golovinomyces cichoracearum TaxID=62708 RepID=A0A420IMI4_9PEZI|nr:Exosome complex component rrp43 [Golovinomyces cichoracearum]
MASQQTQKGLSFTRETFARLSPHPYLLAHLQQSSPSTPSRANGRVPSQFRPPHINRGSLTHAEGSAVVRIGDTTVVCGVRGEILLASKVAGLRTEKKLTTESSSRNGYSEAQKLDLLVPNIELATGCSPNFLPGLPPSTLAQSLSSRIYALLHSSRLIDSEDLKIWYQPPDLSCPNQKMDLDSDEGQDKQIIDDSEIKGFWTLYIDILLISLDGNPFDAAWIAVLSALKDTKLPKAYWDPDLETILCHDEISLSKKLQLRGLPIATTAVVFRAKDKSHHLTRDNNHWVLIDPDTFEESLCDESVTITVDLSTNECKILGITKSGGTIVGPKQINEIKSCAEKRWLELSELLNK